MALAGIETKTKDRSLMLLDSYQRLEALHGAFEGAALMLEQTRAAPLCVEDCGKCCESNVPYVWGIEAEYILSCTPGLRGMSQLVQACEDWLVAHDSRLTIHGPVKPPTQQSKEYSDRLMMEWAMVFQGGCPLLTVDKRCSIHPSRPLACRAYGVTHIPDPFCPRPLAPGETQTKQMFFGEPATLRDLLAETMGTIPEPELRMAWPLPTALVRWAKPDKFKLLEQNGSVPTARLMRMHKSPAILWQGQMDTMIAALLKEAAKPVPLVQSPEDVGRRNSPFQIHEHDFIRELKEQAKE